MDRISKRDYQMGFAVQAAKRSTCRMAVGAACFNGDSLISTGYNGAPRTMDECLTNGCMMEHGHCVRTVHAEMNALLNMLERGGINHHTVMYVTHSPCYDCLIHISNTPIRTIYFIKSYPDIEKAAETMQKFPDIAFYKMP